jgi:hypothetical protein
LTVKNTSSNFRIGVLSLARYFAYPLTFRRASLAFEFLGELAPALGADVVLRSVDFPGQALVDPAAQGTGLMRSFLPFHHLR